MGINKISTVIFLNKTIPIKPINSFFQETDIIEFKKHVVPTK